MATLPIPKLSSAQILNGTAAAAQGLADYIFTNFGKVLLITGAACSIDSGIPCKSGITNDLTKFQTFKDVSYSSYNALESQRQRWWARAIYQYYLNYLEANPNKIHFMINELVKQNAFQGHITLNIDGLFQKAGAPKDRFAERCGNFLDPVVCFSCKAEMDGKEHLSHLLAINPFHAEHIAELKLTAGVLGTDPVRATVLPPTTIDGEMVVTNRLPLKFFNLVPCPECGKKALTPGHILNGSLPKKSTIAMMDKLCGRPPKSTPVDPLLSNLGDYPEEEQKAIMGEEHFDKVELPKAILVVGSALQNIGITSLQVKASLNDLPLAVLDIHPPSQWNIIKEPELIFKAPVRPTLEAAVEHLAKMRAAK